MCQTLNDRNVQSCKYCGYIFENFESLGISTPGNNYHLPQFEQARPASINTIPSPSSADVFPVPSASTVSTGSPLFVVTKSLFASMAPYILYFVFISFIFATSAFNLFSLAIIAVFILAAFLRILFAPRKYEFSDASLRIHKIIGGDSEILYSDLELYDNPAGRRPQIVLSIAGQRKPVVIPGNPTNNELSQDLKQFLSKKLKKYNPQPKDSGQSAPASDANVDDSVDNATS